MKYSIFCILASVLLCVLRYAMGLLNIPLIVALAPALSCLIVFVTRFIQVMITIIKVYRENQLL